MSAGLRVLVCGGRTYAHRDRVFRTLDGLCGEVSEESPLGTICLMIIHGDCPTGADRWADEWAVVNWSPCLRFPADWDAIDVPGAVIKHRNGKPYNALAGFSRNQRMLDEGKPDLVIAFPGRNGTADMVRRAKKAGVRVMVVE